MKMNRKQLCATAAILFTASALPALAAMENLGTVDVNGRDDHDVLYSRFGGSVESIQLRASDSNINCRSVVAKFGNGKSRQIYSGRLSEGRATNVDLPGEARRLSSLAFNCRSDERWGGKIRILADVGRYKNEWQRNPNWTQYYSQLFNWDSAGRGDGRNDRNGMARHHANDRWVQVGSEKFEGRHDRESTTTGWAGRNIDSIALMPMESNARCQRVTANFRQGGDQRLDINRGEVLRRGQFNSIDLPGNRRDVRSIQLSCRAEGAGNVTIRVFTSK